MNIDLNIENYNLEDILNIFKLDINFCEEDLNNAKKIVLKTHPDKSGLNKDIFLFYCKAFRIIKNINDFRNKDIKCQHTKYTKSNYINDFDNESNQEIVNNIMKNKKENFSKWFNKLFEKLNLNDDLDNGYGDWLKSNEDFDETDRVNNLNLMHEKIEIKKKKISQLIRKKDYNSLEYSSNQCFLDGTKNFNSDIFSNLNYQDLKNAHEESLIPICKEDYDNRLKFNNVYSYKQYRDKQNIQSLSKEESEKILNNTYNKNQDIATNVAYKLLKDEEINREKNKLWWSSLKLLS